MLQDFSRLESLQTGRVGLHQGGPNHPVTVESLLMPPGPTRESSKTA